MTTPTRPEPPPAEGEPLFDEVVVELGYNPAHPEEPAGDAFDSEPEDPAPATT